MSPIIQFFGASEENVTTDEVAEMNVDDSEVNSDDSVADGRIVVEVVTPPLNPVEFMPVLHGVETDVNGPVHGDGHGGSVLQIDMLLPSAVAEFGATVSRQSLHEGPSSSTTEHIHTNGAVLVQISKPAILLQRS